MGIGTGTALLIGTGVSAATGIAGSALQSNAAQNAAQTQSAASENAAQLQYQAEQNALGFQEQQYLTGQAELSPYLSAGYGALGQLSSGLGLQNNINPSTNGVYPLGTQPIATPSSSTLSANDLTGQPAATGATSAPAANPNFPGSGGQATTGQATGIPTSATGVSGNGRPQGGGTQAAVQQSGSPFSTSNALGGSAVAGGIGAQGTSGVPTVSANGVPLNTQGNLNAASLNEQWATPFNAPTAAQAAATPGEQFEQQQGEQAIQNSAAAQGNLLSGSTLKGLDSYSQNLASTYYQQAYQNALGQYQQNYNIFNQNQNTAYNRLASVAGLGQTTAGQLSSSGQNAAALNTQTQLGSASAIGQAQQNAAAATASGYVGSANALAGGIGNAAGALNSVATLQYLNGQSGGLGVGNGLTDPYTGLQAVGSSAEPIGG
jgi:hypothetical protein